MHLTLALLLKAFYTLLILSPVLAYPLTDPLPISVGLKALLQLPLPYHLLIMCFDMPLPTYLVISGDYLLYINMVAIYYLSCR